MDFKNIICSLEDNIFWIKINRPEKRNALNKATRAELRQALEHIKTVRDIKVVVITGSGDKAFIAGADVSDLLDMGPFEMEEYLATLSQQLYTDIENLSIPVIAMINGVAVGGGLELALASDIRIASENAKFGLTEINLGVIPGGGGTQRLPRLIGAGRAKELILTGDIIDAHEALRIGMVNKVVPQERLEATVREMAQKIASKSMVAIRFAKKAINAAMKTSLDSGLAYEALLECLCFATEDRKEGMSAFLEKRKPKFVGR